MRPRTLEREYRQPGTSCVTQSWVRLSGTTGLPRWGFAPRFAGSGWDRIGNLSLLLVFDFTVQRI